MEQGSGRWLARAHLCLSLFPSPPLSLWVRMRASRRGGECCESIAQRGPIVLPSGRFGLRPGGASSGWQPTSRPQAAGSRHADCASRPAWSEISIRGTSSSQHAQAGAPSCSLGQRTSPSVWRFHQSTARPFFGWQTDNRHHPARVSVQLSSPERRRRRRTACRRRLCSSPGPPPPVSPSPPRTR